MEICVVPVDDVSNREGVDGEEQWAKDGALGDAADMGKIG